MKSFEKYQGLGNDFIIVEIANESLIDANEAMKLCDRHFGLGADGVLYVLPSTYESQEIAKMIVINSDGSRPEMCGNGLRCVALYLIHQKREKEGEFIVDTDAGLRSCRAKLENKGRAIITTSLGAARVTGSISDSNEAKADPFMQVSIGNPHAIRFQKRIAAEALDELGARLSGQIPGGSNVEIAEVISRRQIIVDVWERGVGRTLACGTGAGATAFAAAQQGLVDSHKPIEVTLPGGTLEVEIKDQDQVLLTGPAQHVYSGQLPQA